MHRREFLLKAAATATMAALAPPSNVLAQCLPRRFIGIWIKEILASQPESPMNQCSDKFLAELTGQTVRIGAGLVQGGRVLTDHDVGERRVA